MTITVPATMSFDTRVCIALAMRVWRAPVSLPEHRSPRGLVPVRLPWSSIHFYFHDPRKLPPPHLIEAP